MAVLEFIANWTASMVWHLWRVATGRPYYRGLSDTGFTLLSFMLVYTAGVLLRWGVVADNDLMSVATIWVTHLFILAMIGMRKDRSSGLFVALLATSAVIDIIASTVVFIEQDLELLRSTGFMVLETVLAMRCIKVFMNQPPEVRASGYHRRNGA